jgi:RNA polymerase sigma-70 factor (ECF subfamily)
VENITNLSDQEVLVAFRNGSERAFEEIHNRYFNKLYLHALKMLGDEQAAQDVVQDVFITFWGKQEELNIHKSLAAYLYTSTRNRVLNVMEQDRVYNHHVHSFATFLEQASFEHHGERNEEEAFYLMFEAEVGRLPPKMKEVFELRMHEDLSYYEIAGKLSISDKTVKKQINNAIKILKMRVMHWRSNLAVVSFLFFN